MKRLILSAFIRTGMLLVFSLSLFQARPLQASENANLNVVSSANSGPGTLRQALLDVTANSIITFDPTVFPPNSPTTIFVKSALPPLNRNNITINASNTDVILDGSQAPNGVNGLIIEAGNCVIQGLTIQHFSSNGIFIATGATGSFIGGDRNAGGGPNGQGNLIGFNHDNGIEIRGNNNQVQGNFIGVDGSGRENAGNQLNGIAIWQGASNNTIGSATGNQRNVIGWNTQNGVWIEGTGTNSNRVIGNYIGAQSDGLGPVGNGFSGVSIQDGAQNNRIGGTTSGEGNLISGNFQNGIYVSGSGTNGNQLLANLIGPDLQHTGIISQLQNGVVINLGASNNLIGDGTPNGRNVISRNALDGVLIADSGTMNNIVEGNYIGANLSGTAALPNGQHGVEITNDAHHNLIGGNRLSGQGNLLSGDSNHGLVIHYGAHHNTASGNIIGPDATGTYSLRNHPFGGIDIGEGSHDNVIGGLAPGEGNLISGNQTDGIALFSDGASTASNQILGNRIGVALGSDTPLPNEGPGISILAGAALTRMEGNTVAYNTGDGIWVVHCSGNTITQNLIYSNTLSGIRNDEQCPVSQNKDIPQLNVVTISATEVVTGTTGIANARVELFSDSNDEGEIYEGFTIADNAGKFTFNSKLGGFTGPNLTATSTDSQGNTSAFFPPAHLMWTLLLYLNGDNDLEEAMFDTFDNMVAAGASPRANVLVLLDGHTAEHAETVLYDVTRSKATPITRRLSITNSVSSELDMGSGQTLIDFVNWGKAHYPAHHTLLSIVDHGGGWAPSITTALPGTLPYHRRDYQAGNSGMSWDFSNDYDHLESQEIRQALAAITNNGTNPLDVVFFDVCLMGMIEVSDQIQEYASFFVSSQNIGWAPTGPQGRYIRTIQGITPTTTPQQMAKLLVKAYADDLPPNGHPFTISAIDLAQLPMITKAVNDLAIMIRKTLTGPTQAATLHIIYDETQKLDYDSDFRIEPATDGFVDLYDFALHVTQQYNDPDVIVAAQNLMNALTAGIIAEQHRSGTPWMPLSQEWDLDNVHGLSIFLPLGEDLELPIVITPSIASSFVITRHLRLRDMYSNEQLQFVRDTAWASLINTYYTAISSPVTTSTTSGPLAGLQTPDVTPPRTMITVTTAHRVGEIIDVKWAATDDQSGVASASLWHRSLSRKWTEITTQLGTSGIFSYTFSPQDSCANNFVVRTIDQAGNLEAIEGIFNSAIINVEACSYLPVISKVP